MAKRVEHLFNRRYKDARREIYLIRTETGWQVLGRIGGSDGEAVTHYFYHENDARKMLDRMKEAVPPELANWAQITAGR
jgi:hypothetical protein